MPTTEMSYAFFCYYYPLSSNSVEKNEPVLGPSTAVISIKYWSKLAQVLE